MKPVRGIILWVLFILFSYSAKTQSYHAISGSPFAGSAGIRNNPASPVNSVYRWDLNLFSFQVTQSTNTLALGNFSLSSQDSTFLKFGNNYSSRFIHTNADVDLLQFHYKLSDTKAIAVGLRGRTYNHIKTQPLWSSDNVYSFNEFFKMNRTTPYLEGFAIHTGWLEGNLNYSQVLSETPSGKLSGGVTLQIMRGLSGAFGKVRRFTYQELTNGTDTAYKLTNAYAIYGYSANYDNATSNNPTVKDFVRNTFTHLGLSFGVEYLVYDTGNDDPDVNKNLNYTWKIGASIMDLGSNAYKASDYSGEFSNVNPNISDTVLAVKMRGVNSVNGLHDTLATIFKSAASIGENFIISNPTRLVINIDRKLDHNFYVNADLSLNFYSTSSYNKLRTRELNLLTITPRWETLAWGAYLPIQYNTQGQLWIGAAVKLGPLLLGIHNIGLLKKDPALNGGGYLMLNIHPFNKKKVITRLDCPQ